VIAVTRLRIVAGLLFAAFAVLTLLDRFVLIELFLRRTTLPLLIVAAQALAMIAAGAALRRTKQTDVPLDFLIGYPLFGAIVFLLSSLSVTIWTIGPLVAGGAVAGSWLLWRRFRAGDPPAARVPPLSWSAFAIAAVLACGVVAAQAPASSLDELAYHLAVPHTWVLEGRAVELPLLSHSYFPLGIESASVLPLLALGPTGGGIASHFLHLLAALATTVLVARRTRSWLATAAIVTTPALAITAGWSLVEWPLTGLFVALYCALEDEDRHTASAVTAAGLLTKYTFIPFAILLWAIKRRIPGWPALFGLVFFGRNLLLTGNPVEPFLGSDAPHVAGFRDLALADYVFEGSFVDEALGASLLALAPFASGIAALATLVLAVGLFLLAPSARILVPFLTIPAMSGAAILKRRVAAAIVASAVAIQVLLVIWFTARAGAFSLIAGGASEEEYLRTARPSYAIIETVNQALPADSRTLVVGHSEMFWFTRPVRGGGNFDGPRISKYLEAHTPEALRERLRRDGITHVVIMRAPLATKVEQKQHERQTALSPLAQKTLARTLDRYADGLTPLEGATLFALR
jgi:hypothetical protein